jgi:hypothetical protein
MANPPRELMDLRAVLDPMLIQASNELTVKVTRTAGRGMFQPGWTCYHTC